LPDQRLALAIEQIDATAHGFPSAPQLDQLPSTRGYAHGVSRIANSLIGDGRLIWGLKIGDWGFYSSICWVLRAPTHSRPA
jgi:hypothetical protein